MDLLNAEDLAYMRATQADARPTAAELARRVTGRTPTGGTTTTYGEAVPVDVRLDAAADEVPETLAARLGTASPVKVVMDLAYDVRDGDRLTVSAVEVYEIVTDGTPDRWATAQIVWAKRTVYPPRVA